MRAILKREFRSYFNSMIGYAFAGFLLLVVGIMFSWISMYNKDPFIGYSLQYSYVTVVFMILVPMITMRTFAEERRTKTDQLLLTSPVSVTGIVLGKYLALLGVLLIPLLIICVYPIILTQFGEVYFAVSYISILGFFLMGMAYMAVGMFVSSLTENQIISAVGTFAVLLLSFMMKSLVKIVSSSAEMSFGVLLVVFALAAWALYHQTRSWIAAVVAGGVLEAATIILYIVNDGLFDGLLKNIMLHLSLNSYYDYFVGGYFELKAVVFYLTVAGFFVFLTVQSIQKRRWS